MRSIIELVISLSLILGSGKYAIDWVHGTVRDLAMSKITKGLSSTRKLNNLVLK